MKFYSSVKSVAFATALLVTVSTQAQETWTWIGGTDDVAAAGNWSLSTPGGLAGPPGIESGTQSDRYASFGATGSTTLTQSNPNYWLEQFIFQPGAQAYTYTATDVAGYLSLAPAATNVDRMVFDNQSTNRQTINMPSGGKIGIDGYVKSNAGGGDIVINGPVLVSDTESTAAAQGSRYVIVTGSGNTYFNVDSSVLPGNVPGGAWLAGGTNGAYNNTRNRFWTDDLSGTVYLGDIGTAYKGTFLLTSNKGGKVRLTNNNSLGDPGAHGGFGGAGASTAVVIYGGDANVNPVTGYNTTLELAGDIEVRRSVMWLGARAGALIGNTPHISNASGNNTLRIGADWNSFGSSFTAGHIAGNWNIESQAGNLTIAGGDVSTSGAIYNTRTTNVNLQLMGAGNGQIDAPLLVWSTAPSLNVVKTGGGTWTLNNIPVADEATIFSTAAANTVSIFTGTLTATEGTLALGGTTTLSGTTTVDVKTNGIFDVTALPGGSLTLNPANALLKGTGKIRGTIVAGTGNTIAPGNSVGTLEFDGAGGGLSLTGGSTIQYELTNTPTNLGGVNDQIVIDGNLSLAGSTTVNVTPLNGSLGSGTYTLMTYAGSLIGNETNLSLTGTPFSARQTFELDDSTANKINLVVTGNAANLSWTGGNGSNWVDGLSDPGSINNWTGAADNRFYNGDNVTFTTGTDTVNVTGSVNPGNVTFNNAGSKNYTLSPLGGGDIAVGGSMAFNNAGTVTFKNNNISAVGSTTLSGTGVVTFENTGTLTLPNVAIGSGSTMVIDRTTFIEDVISTTFTGAGTLRIENSSAPAVLSGDNSGFTGTTEVAAGTTLKTQGNNALTNTTVLSGGTLQVGDNGPVAPGGGNKAVSISGTGVGGIGALVADSSGAHVGNLTLTGNAKITAGQTGYTVLWIDGLITGNGFGLETFIDRNLNAGQEIDMINNGNANFGDVTITGGGALYLGGNTSLGNTGTINLGDGATGGELGLYGSADPLVASTVPVEKDIVVTANVINGLSVYNGSATFNSDITMNSDLQVNVHPRVTNSNSIATLNGKLTGPGGLAVHRAAGTSNVTSRLATVELTSDANDYAGFTTIGGGGGIYNPTVTRDSFVTLSIGNGGSTGEIGPNDVINDGTLQINQNDAYLLDNLITSSLAAGNVNQVGSGTTTISNNNTYTGQTGVSGGTLRVTGSHHTGSRYYVGRNAGEEGTLILDGTGITTSSHFFVGADGTGHFTMMNGDLVVGEQLSVGDNPTAVGDFNHLNGNVTVNLDATVGWLGNGTYIMNTATGSLQMFANLYVGRGGTGEFRLLDGTVTVAGSLDIGAGTVTVAADQTMTVGGIVNSAGAGVINIGGSPYPDGDYNLDGKVNAADYPVWRDAIGNPAAYALWKANFGSTAGAPGGPALLDAGFGTAAVDTLNLSNGTLTANGGVTIDTEITGNGTVNGIVTMADTAVVDPGFGPGKLNFANDLNLGANGTLNIEIGGNTAVTQFDQINVTGLLNAAGTLSVSLINGFTPANNSSFNILDFGTFGTNFTTLTFSSGTWDTSLLTTTGVIKYLNAGSGSSANIPEPATWALLAVGLIGLLGVRSTRRK